MSETGRNEEQQNVRDVERNNDQELGDLAPTPEVPINIVRPPRHSTSKFEYWKLLLIGSVFTVGGVAGLTYVFLNSTELLYLATLASALSFGIGLALVVRSIVKLFIDPLFDRPRTTRRFRDFEELESLRFRQLLDRHFGTQT